MKLFLGEYSHTLDDRGRITLPKKMRAELEGRDIILSRGFDGCIFGYDRKQWEEEAGKQLASSVTDQKGRAMRRYMFGAAENAEVDKLGRMVLPTHLKEYGKINDKVRVIGAGDHFEIWDETRWNEYQKEMERA